MPLHPQLLNIQSGSQYLIHAQRQIRIFSVIKTISDFKQYINLYSGFKSKNFGNGLYDLLSVSDPEMLSYVQASLPLDSFIILRNYIPTESYFQILSNSLFFLINYPYLEPYIYQPSTRVIDAFASNTMPIVTRTPAIEQFCADYSFHPKPFFYDCISSNDASQIIDLYSTSWISADSLALSTLMNVDI